MQAIILAAGIGNRLGDEAGNKPKSMLEFNGKSLLQRHVELLKRNGVNQVNLVVGYQSELIIEHLEDSSSDIRFIHNPRYTEGSLISLNCARDIMLQESQYLIMDADVLYDEKILSRLI
ncbi:MAG: NTP transferase domain-containing protein, partial [Gammaproteobacteria bacterium]